MLGRFIAIGKIAVWTWAVLIGSLTCLGALTSGGHAFGGLVIGLTIASLPLGAMLWAGRARKARQARVHAGMLAELGIGPGDYEHGEDGTGIALNRRARAVTLMQGGRWKTYPFSDVRGWSTHFATGGLGAPGSSGVGAGFVAMGANLEAARDAKARTGLFVEVRDVERSKWRIAMGDERQQARWMEILQQEINESRTGAAHAHA